VGRGDVWRVGGHVYLCSDLMDQNPDECATWNNLVTGVFSGVPRPTLVYTDPPWGQGLANGFRTKAGLDRASYDWTDIYKTIANASRLLGIGAWFEGPAIEKPDGLKIPGILMQGPGYRKYHRLTYMGGKPSGLFYASPTWPAPEFELTDNSGFAAVGEVLAHYEPGVLLDPCAGLGGIPLTGELLGWMSVNNELNPKRMGRALARMADATGAAPVRIA